MSESPSLNVQKQVLRFDPSEPFVLLENQTQKDIITPFQLFFETVEEIKTHEPSQVMSCLNRIEELSKKAHHLVGYIAYEALHPEFDLLLAKKNKAQSQSLVHFHAFAKRVLLSQAEWDELIMPRLIRAELASGNFNNSIRPAVFDFEYNENFNSYQKKITKIKEHLKNGNTYQVNFTFKNRFQWQGRVFDIFTELKKYQLVNMAGFYHFDFDVCSYSPELFINKKADLITAKPMKGTAPRGVNAQQDEQIKDQMQKDEKTLSENLMIVDLIRNDLGRVAEPCSVNVPKLFEIEAYSTLFQMTSTVQAQVQKSLSFSDLLKALFPCGSITGAPKKSTMQIIDELETESRGLYTGALGYLEPSGDFQFNVAIRTLILGHTDDRVRIGEMGIGSGIVYQSEARSEWEECLLKSRFVKLINSPIQLIETFCWDGKLQNYLRLELHLQRLNRSAKALGFQCSIDQIKMALIDLNNHLLSLQHNSKKQVEDQLINISCKDLSSTHLSYRVRLILFQNGAIQLTHSILEPVLQIYKVALCSVPIHSASIFQRHKTTQRQLYDRYYFLAKNLGFDEVLFFNEHNNCVEASRHNIFIKKQDQFLTPALNEGALPGVLRQELLLDPNFSLKEARINFNDIKNADAIYLGNSLRGLNRAEIIEQWLEQDPDFEPEFKLPKDER